MDVRAQVSEMSQETREALARRIRSRLLRADDPATDHDVSIAGGGVAALTLALEIRRARPTTRILIIEPNAHPVAEITHTVGESTVEVAAHYLRDRLGLADHLRSSQLRKMGLRMFFSHERKHRYCAANGTRKLLVCASGDLPDRSRQVGKRAYPTLHLGRRGSRSWSSPIGRAGRAEWSARHFHSTRGHSHPEDGAVAG